MTEGVGLGEQLRDVPGAENDEDVLARIVPAAEELRDALDPGETGVVVTHGAALRLAIGGLARVGEQRRPDARRADNCHWATVLVPVDEGQRRLHVYGMGDFASSAGHWLGFPGCPEPHGSGQRGCGAAGSAPPWHGGGQGFESPQLHRTRDRGRTWRSSPTSGWWHGGG